MSIYFSKIENSIPSTDQDIRRRGSPFVSTDSNYDTGNGQFRHSAKFTSTPEKPPLQLKRASQN
jgi:hypothetical protein